MVNMHRRFSLDKRAALEGLPLYLIIMVVVAGVVIVILLSWLSSVNHAGIGSISANFYGKGNIAVNIYGCTTSGASAGNLCYNSGTSGTCDFSNNTKATANGPPLVVTVYDTKGNALSGVTVQLSLSAGFDWGSVPTSGTTASNGNVVFSALAGHISANTDSGTLSITATDSSGTSTTQSTQLTINVIPPQC